MNLNLAVGLACVIIGLLVALVGFLRAARDTLGPRRELYAGRILEGIAGILNAAAALFEAIRNAPFSAVLLILGLIFIVLGLVIIVAQPI